MRSLNLHRKAALTLVCLASTCAAAALSGCSPTTVTNIGSATPPMVKMAAAKSPDVVPKVTPELDQSLMAAAQSFGQKWPLKPQVLTTGSVNLQFGKWYRSGPARMVIKSHSIEQGTPPVGEYVGHVLYEEQCRNSAGFPTRQQAAAAPFTQPGSGVIGVNFAYQKGQWKYLNGV